MHEPDGRPTTTQINGQPADWTPEIWQKWYTAADWADPKLTTLHVKSANYFTPRPYQHEYSRGSREEGFTYVIGRDWTENRVYQVVVSTLAEVPHART